MKVFVKAHILTLWLLIKGEIPLIEKFTSACFGNLFIKMSTFTLIPVKILRSKVI